MPARAILVAGTSSEAGKSALAAALGRILARRGVRVAPFKAWNMSLNSGVTPDGREIARAQILQADACGVAPRAEMNPLLLKPEGNGRSQVIVLGRPVGSRRFRNDPRVLRRRRAVARAAYARLAAAFDCVVIEGAGAAAEPNLRGRDVANFWMARRAGAPVLLVADIGRGGAFAALYGTWALLPPGDRRRIAGFVVNRLHGDARLLGEGPAILTRRTGIPFLGAVPYVSGLALDAEDGVTLDALPRRFAGAPGAVRIAAVRFPRISQFTDLAPLALSRAVEVAVTADPEVLAAAHVVLLPGSKTTAADLAWMRARGLDGAVRRAARAGRFVVGLCGGFQMMGLTLRDPLGMESAARAAPGLGLLPGRTVFSRDKTLSWTGATCRLPFFAGGRVSGYEVHCGVTAHAVAGARPAFRTEGAGAPGRPEGLWRAGGRVFGTYLHGIFENDRFREAFLAAVRARFSLPRPAGPRLSFRARRLAEIDRWADVVEASLDLAPLWSKMGLAFPRRNGKMISLASPRRRVCSVS